MFSKRYSSLSDEAKTRLTQTFTYAVLIIVSITTVSLLFKYANISLLLVGTTTSNTWSTQVINKPIRDINLSPIQNVENVLSGGLSWTDYTTKFEANQPNISSNSSSKNTEEIHNYLYKNRLLFDIPAGKNGLLLIVTKKPVAEDRNLFLAIWWSTKWELRKEKSIPTNSENKYLFDINNLPIARFTPGISLFDNTIDWKIQIGVLVGEKDNSVESVTMIFY